MIHTDWGPLRLQLTTQCPEEELPSQLLISGMSKGTSQRYGGDVARC